MYRVPTARYAVGVCARQEWNGQPQLADAAVRESLGDMSKLVAESGKISAVSTFKADGISVAFKHAAIATTGDLGEVRISGEVGHLTLTYAQAVTLANQILARCQRERPGVIT